MKRVLFVIPAFSIGGTNTSLVSLLPYVDRTQYDVYVYALSPVGPMGKEIARYCTVLNTIEPGTLSSSSSNSSGSTIKILLKRIKRFFDRIGIDLKPIVYRKQVKSLAVRSFDCVIAFQEGEATRFVQYFRNTRKAAWIRADYSRYLSIARIEPEVALYNKYDVIVNVSKSALNSFLNLMPQCKGKSIYIYNLVDRERILSLSKSPDVAVQNYAEFTIVSLGRVDKVKHFTDIPVIAKTLSDHGISFHWMIIGGPTVRYPEEYELLKKGIVDGDLSSRVELLGHQSNPYPYLAKSNLLVCLSESETFNHTFAEARSLGIPVLSVDYPGSDELLGNRKGGLTVKREMICETIERIITDSESYTILKQEAESFLFDNSSQLKRLTDYVFEGHS